MNNPDPTKSRQFPENTSSNARIWIRKCDLFFNTHKTKFTNDTTKIAYTCSLLKGIAFCWAEKFIDEIQNEGTPKWNDFKNEFITEFADPNEKQIALHKLTTVKQKGTVSSYIQYFNLLLLQAGWNKTHNPDTLVQLFLKGLEHSTQTLIILSNKPTKTLDEIQEIALITESKQNLLKINNPEEEQRNPNNQFYFQNNNPHRDKQCYNCQRTGHIMKNC